jgi:hypothetical protein
MALAVHLEALIEPGVNPESRRAGVEAIATTRSPGTAA